MFSKRLDLTCHFWKRSGVEKNIIQLKCELGLLVKTKIGNKKLSRKFTMEEDTGQQDCTSQGKLR